jgi:hypothetical protein
MNARIARMIRESSAPEDPLGTTLMFAFAVVLVAIAILS